MLGRKEEAAKTWRDAAKAHPDNTVLADVIKKFKPEARCPDARSASLAARHRPCAHRRPK